MVDLIPVKAVIFQWTTKDFLMRLETLKMNNKEKWLIEKEDAKRRKLTSAKRSPHGYLDFQEIIQKSGKYVNLLIRKQFKFHGTYDELSVKNLKDCARNLFDKRDSAVTLMKTLLGPVIDNDDQIVQSTKIFLVLFSAPDPCHPSMVTSTLLNTASYRSIASHQSSQVEIIKPPGHAVTPTFPKSKINLESFMKFATHKQNEDIYHLETQEFVYEYNSFLLPRKLAYKKHPEIQLTSGGLRTAEVVTIIESDNPKIKVMQKYVLKKYRDGLSEEASGVFSDEEACKRTVKMQDFSSVVCQKFNSQPIAARKLNVLPSYLTITKENSGIIWGTMEPYMEGVYHKYCNNDWDYINSDDPNHLLFQTLSHYSYYFTQNQAILTDLQGVGCCLTDLEVATVAAAAKIDDTDDLQLLFGYGNLHEVAINNFKRKHVCNYMCAMLKLPKL